jgi:glycogen phosphorylase
LGNVRNLLSAGGGVFVNRGSVHNILSAGDGTAGSVWQPVPTALAGQGVGGDGLSGDSTGALMGSLYQLSNDLTDPLQAAKQIIRLINDVAGVVNRDARCKGWLQVVFVPDYRVSLAEVIMPAAELSEQISTAGTEASGTGNMKFMLNGALTIGTLDGANIEMREEAGAENIFIFGLTADEVRRIRSGPGYRPLELYHSSPIVRNVLDALGQNRFCPKEPGRHAWIAQRLLAENEPYFHLADLESYLAAHEEAARVYRDHPAWAAKAILNVARVGKFSSDRTIRDYAREIWNIKPV